MGDGRFGNRPYGNCLVAVRLVEGGWFETPHNREDTGKGRWERWVPACARTREGGYMRPGIFSPPVRLPSFWPAIS